MYEAFYGLQERPFNLTPDPRFLYLSPRHREALGNLTYGVVGSRAITLLIGDAGTGKTTLVRSALAEARPGTSYVVVSNPTLTRAEFVSFLASSFGLTREAAGSKAVWLVELEALLRERHAKKIVTALMVDEAQSLSEELLEEVRLLSNIETDTDKLLPIILAGQPELAARLEQPALRHLKQRIALRCELQAFDLSASAAYVATRLRVAGGSPRDVFTRDAIVAIHEASGGIPRTINVLCDNSLLAGFAAGERPVGRRLVAEVSRDFRFDGTRDDADHRAPNSADIRSASADADAPSGVAPGIAPGVPDEEPVQDAPVGRFPRLPIFRSKG